MRRMKKAILKILFILSLSLWAISAQANPFPFGFFQPPVVVGGGGTATLTYSSDGDANGVFYFAGKGYATGGTWTNPYTQGSITLTSAFSLGTGTIPEIVDRVSSSIDEYGTAPWFVVDLGPDKSLVCNYASYRQRTGGPTNSSNSFDLQGSNDATSWTALSSQTGVSTTEATWRSFSVSGSTGYRYFRIIRPSVTDYLTIGEWELYGSLTYLPLTKLTGTGFESSDYGGYPASNAFDNNLATFSLTSGASGSYLGLDLGSGNAAVIKQVRILSRSGYETDLASAIVEGSNTSSTSGYTTIGTLPSTIIPDGYNAIAVANATAWRWVRIRKTGASYLGTVELQFYKTP